MRREKRLHCIFTLPIIILLLYFGAALSNRVAVERVDEIRYYDAGGLELSQAEPVPGNAAEDDFDEPEWVDFHVNRMLYDGLSDAGKTAYRSLYDAVLDHRETVYIPMLSSRELSDVHAALKYDNPHLPCVSNEFSYGTFGALCYVKMQYDYSRTECDALSMALINSARSLCEGCGSLSAYEKELRLHDALIRLVSYEDGGVNANTAAGALVDRKAVCAGYALGMKLMCDMAGLESCVVRGGAVSSAGEEAHAWLIVRVDGEWYHLDPTWDDPVNDSDRDQLTHAYFNVPTEWISEDHFGFSLPEGVQCGAVKDNYYVRQGLFCRRDDWQYVVKSAVADGFETLPCEAEFRFEDADLFEEAYGALLDGEINTIINEIIREHDYPTERWKVSSQSFNSMNTIRFIIADYYEE